MPQGVLIRGDSCAPGDSMEWGIQGVGEFYALGVYIS
jgi:hypothetical protein